MKIDPLNYLYFRCQYYDNRIISVEQEWETEWDSQQDRKEVENKYDNIYQVKIREITLRELMILQSFYLCINQEDISNLVRMQPTPELFYKTFLEFDGANFLSMLAFDSSSISSLLGD